MQSLKNMLKRSIRNIDWWLTVPIGFLAILCNFLLPYDEGTICVTICDILRIVAGCLGIIYILYAISLWFQRPKFDWHLVNGHFLLKVCCLVVLMPSILSCVGILLLDSPNDLGFDLNPYDKGEIINEINYKGNSSNIYWSTYYHFIDPGNQSLSTTKIARAWVAIVAVCGIFLLNGLLVSSIIGWIDRRKEMWKSGKVKYNGFLRRNRHFVIIGGNDMVGAIIKQMLPNKQPILILTSRNIEEFRQELFSSLNDEEQKYIIIYYGSRTSYENIKELYLENTDEVYILGEETRIDDMESFHDTMNMECLGLIKEYSITHPQTEEGKRIVCRVMFEYQTTFSVFQFYDIDKEVEMNVDFRPFNYYELWAQKLLLNKELNPLNLEELTVNGGYLPLEGTEGIKMDDDIYVHLFIVGMSRMGIAMGIEAAHIAHYPNYEQKKKRTKITFIDKKACEEKDFFMGRFKELFSLSHWRYGDVEEKSLIWKEVHAPRDIDYLGGDFLDVEWEFINGGLEHTLIQDYILKSVNKNAKITIAVCLPESNRAHAAALYIDKKIYASENLIQVLVYNRYGKSIMQALSSRKVMYPYLNKLKAFGAPKDCFEGNWFVVHEGVGKIIRDKYNEINELYKETYSEESKQNNEVGGYKGKSSTAKFWSSIYNGNTVWTKLRSIEYKEGDLSSEQIDILSDVEHNRWNMEQLLMNFRPLTKGEQEEVINGRKDKEVLKGEMAHLNICSNKRLAELEIIDVGTRAYDKGLTSLLPKIYSELKHL